MTTYFITHHPGARQWAAQEGIRVDDLVDHLDVNLIRPGDVIIGTLPVSGRARRGSLKPQDCRLHSQ